ncbi:MAG: hypothetical protein ACE5OZ_18320 [Candidatus Heimdallarchaeota archaeon]
MYSKRLNGFVFICLLLLFINSFLPKTHVECVVEVQRHANLDDSFFIFTFRNYGAWTAKNLKMTVTIIPLSDLRAGYVWKRIGSFQIGNVDSIDSITRKMAFSRFFDSMEEYHAGIKEVKVLSEWTEGSQSREFATTNKYSQNRDTESEELDTENPFFIIPTLPTNFLVILNIILLICAYILIYRKFFCK